MHLLVGATTSKLIEVESTEGRGGVGAQVQVATMFTRFTNRRDHYSVRIMEAPPDRSILVQLQYKPIFGHKFHGHLLTEQLEDQILKPRARSEEIHC